MQPATLFSISCDIQTNFWTPFGSIKECLLKNINVTTHRASIDFVSNQFTNMNEITSLNIDLSPMCFYVPLGMEVFFQNLKVLSITRSGLKMVTAEDLKPFVHLRGIYFDNNKLETLEANVFDFNIDLEEIVLSENKLTSIENNVFDSLPKLMKLDLLRNVCIDKAALSYSDIKSLKKELRSSCATKEIGQELKGGISFASFEALMNKIVALESKLSNLELQFKDAMESVCDVCRTKV